ncbi:hypothetical protein [Segnochrobactrum spirostomi]|uniref:MFS transporter n=1 Tax=Segnochrobactrum spirostomi TaxID=2608987 RepID=A0A6A7Y2A0_9HYPH|nr:hypothetical protein [Segnochrobactrum spirostomi]MQT12478.1 hypothetical protein [Segnochrobactrum spirostomi]
MPILAALFVAVLSLGLSHPLVVALFAEGRIVEGLGTTAQSALLGLAFAALPFGVGLGVLAVGASRTGSRAAAFDWRTMLLSGAAGLAAGSALTWAGVHLEGIMLLLAGRLVVGAAAGVAIAAALTTMDPGEAADLMARWAAGLIAPVAAIAFVGGPALGGVLAGIDPETPPVATLCLALAAFIWLRRGTAEGRTALAPPFAADPGDVDRAAPRGSAAAFLGAAWVLQGLGWGLAVSFASIRMVGAFGLSPLGLGLFGAVAALGAVVGGAIAVRGGNGRRNRGAVIAGALVAFSLPVAASVLPNVGLALQWPLAVAAGLFGGVAAAGTCRRFVEAMGEAEAGLRRALAIGAFAFAAATLASALLGRVPAEAMIVVAAGVDLLAILPLAAGLKAAGTRPAA